MHITLRTYLYTFILGTILVFSIWGDNGLMKYLRHQREVTELKDQLARLKDDITTTEDELFKTTNNLSFLEKVSREELGLSRSGEVIYVFPNATKSENAISSLR